MFCNKCSRCMITMKPGTSFQYDHGQNKTIHFVECPKCHERKFLNFTDNSKTGNSFKLNK